MNRLTSLMILFFFQLLFGQNQLCQTDILNTMDVQQLKATKDWDKLDFSNLWLNTADESIFGIIGNEHQRIYIKFISLVKNSNKPDDYLVYGKSNVKNNTCDFIGKITIVKIQEITGENYGVDDEYKDSGIKFQGLLTATYEFFEKNDQLHSGYFTGTAQSLFYIDKNGKPKYNDLSAFSDGYFNNSFVGKWKMYNSNLEKICNWGDYRVPDSNCDFDIGVGEISVSGKYWKNGWMDFSLKNQTNGDSYNQRKSNEKKWWK